ncbi:MULTISPECIES: glycosyltransferase family 2 protein [Acinetobacter]|uniref:glycosyltransferase family 2 protein n=1 Tax=Acinetobacter TaxID=469 RepID=UPI000235F4F0|nr:MULTISPECIES: glycosyltransferase [Acinetobacter]MDA0696028.1 glycosyltransferase [Pseudomonadota bacterium]KXZ65269.1 Poly-beta-1,6-N-acetyl-D-glucosamine synthase [Acinetobacter venetianus]KXZ74785.1 Poly-beta-1,6-N-acetyl-D-glucosamine synthase [Acinetobacter venetianus]MDA1253297.1 glycosyltransferase [Pseudomonadota bacterium]GAB01968.1 putative glycosyltransferase [Acinetobacter sp. NBRC 100985]
MPAIDVLFLFGFLGIWIPQAFWAWLSYQAWKYSKNAARELENMPVPEQWPFLSVLIPAYNEGVVIEDTLHAIAQQDYPAHAYEVLLINDGSKDNTLEIAERMAAIYPCIKIVNVPKGMGGKGKSRTLNNGLPHAKGELIVVYDADSTPEPDCVRLLAQTLLADKKLVAVNGKVRTRNWRDSILTRFIAIEFIFFQWIFQGGRWQRFELSTLMGTNYVIWRDALETLGGFDEKSLVDDTEMSFRIFLGQRRIKWVPYAVGWQQDPPSLSVFIKQRSRWTQGNFYVTSKYLPIALRKPFPIGIEIFNNIMCYVLFVPALIWSHITLSLGLLGIAGITLAGPFTLLWGLSFCLYVAQMWFTLSLERAKPQLYFFSVLSYVTYSQIFLFIVFKAAYDMLKNKIQGNSLQWYKTERSKERK